MSAGVRCGVFDMLATHGANVKGRVGTLCSERLHGLRLSPRRGHDGLSVLLSEEVLGGLGCGEGALTNRPVCGVEVVRGKIQRLINTRGVKKKCVGDVVE